MKRQGFKYFGFMNYFYADIFNFILFIIYFWLYWVFAVCRLLSSCRAQASHCDCFSGCRVQASGHTGFNNCGSWAPEHRLSSCDVCAPLLHCMWNLPGSGIEPASPALAGRFFTTELPGKPRRYFKEKVFFMFDIDFFFNCSVVDLQCCANFCCIAKWLSYTHTHVCIHSVLYSFPYGLSQDTEYSSLC